MGRRLLATSRSSNRLGTENGGDALPVTTVSKGLRTAKVWRRIDAVERSLGLSDEQGSEEEIVRQIVQELSPEDLSL